MERQQINPWTWQKRLGIAHAWRVDGPSTIVFLSGQGPLDDEGQVVGVGDFEAQTRRVFENIGTVLKQAGGSFASIVRLTVYVTDMRMIADYLRVRDEFIDRSVPPASAALGVASLAFPGMMIEVDTIAVL